MSPVFELSLFSSQIGSPEVSTNPARGLNSDLYLLGIIVRVSICFYWDVTERQ